MKNITRSQAIDIIRAELLKLSDEEHSVCEVAARKGIFCQGFKQFSTRDLFKKYAWLVKTLGIRSREELEKYANLWQITRQQFHGNECACDVQTEEHDTCLGWDTFTDAQLAGFIRELNGEAVSVGPDAAESSAAAPA